MSTYDDIPYASYAYARTHPDRMCTIGRLFGLRPASVERCRVLELGSGGGGNLLPMAQQLPGSTFLGIDASATHIEEANALLDAAPMPNVTLSHHDILDVDDDWGEFDYIICHGVFSWVSRAVQDKILTILERNLAPQGIGYVSYNVYPGWHMREMVRHMMRYHVRNIEDPKARVPQARALIDFLRASAADNDTAFSALLQRELDLLRTTGNDYVFHEHLEEVNAPIYFHQFVERIRPHGLQYLGETDLHTMLVRQYAPNVARTLEHITQDIESREQYMDFVRNRQFRATLVCRDGAATRRRLRPEIVEDFAFDFGATQDAAPIDLLEGIHHEFRASADVTVGTARSITKAALITLRTHWPRALRFGELYARSKALLEQERIEIGPSARADLGADLLECCFGATGLGLRSWTPPVASRAPSHPAVTPLARAQALRYGRATTMLHQDLSLERGPARIVGLLDGTRDRDAIVAALAKDVVEGQLELTHEGRKLAEGDELGPPLRAALDGALAYFTRHGLLLHEGRSGPVVSGDKIGSA